MRIFEASRSDFHLCSISGESFYGEPFADEPHQRLKFNRRGLVAMANTGEVNHNESQFFVSSPRHHLVSF